MKRTIIAVIGAFLALLLGAVQANAADAHMGGVLGFSPKYSTMTGPQGQTCNTATTCKKIRYDNISTQSAERNLATWVAANGKTGNTIWVYSESAAAAALYLNKNLDDQNTWIMVGSPGKPGNGDPRYQLTNTTAKVDFVTVVGDSVALPGTGGSLRTHMRGYDYLDARAPLTSTPVPGTNTTDNVYKPVKRTGWEWLTKLLGLEYGPVVLPATQARTAAAPVADTERIEVAHTVSAPATESEAPARKLSLVPTPATATATPAPVDETDKVRTGQDSAVQRADKAWKRSTSADDAEQPGTDQVSVTDAATDDEKADEPAAGTESPAASREGDSDDQGDSDDTAKAAA